jgi:hypothetical protein
MTLIIRSMIPDQDKPLVTPAGRVVIAELVEVHSPGSEDKIATLTGYYSSGSTLPSLKLQLHLTVKHMQLLNYRGSVLYGGLDDPDKE